MLAAHCSNEKNIMNHSINLFANKSDSFILSIGYLIIAIIGIIDILIPSSIIIEALYVPPIIIINWYTSKNQGILASIIVSIYIATHHLLMMSDDPIIVSYNVMIALSIFVLITLMFSKLKQKIDIEVKLYDAERQRSLKSFQSRIAISALLETALSKLSLDKQLEVAIEIILNVPWLALEDKGSIFLFDKREQVLRMKTSKNIPELKTLCNKVRIGECLCGRSAELKDIVFSSHIDSEHTTKYNNMKPHGHYCIPIMKELDLVGVLNLYVSDGHIDDNEERNFLSVAAATIASLIELRKIEQENKRLELELRRNAQIDYLTCLSNRRYFIEQGEVEFARSVRYNRILSVLMFDIDHFKKVNDTYGHSVGDLVIQKVAEVSRIVLRDIDEIGRIGGEEFSIILPETSRENALLAAERLRSSIEKTKIIFNDSIVSITISIGVASLIKNECSHIEDLLNMADKALYDAKNTGRNRVRFYAKT